MKEITNFFGINIGNFPEQNILFKNVTGIQWGNGVGKGVLTRQMIIALSTRLDYDIKNFQNLNTLETKFLSEHSLSTGGKRIKNDEERLKNLKLAFSEIFNANKKLEGRSFIGLYFEDITNNNYTITITYPKINNILKLNRVYIKLKDKDSFEKVRSYLLKRIKIEENNTQDIIELIEEDLYEEISSNLIKEDNTNKNSSYLQEKTPFYMGIKDKFDYGSDIITAFSQKETSVIDESIKIKSINEVLTKYEEDNSLKMFFSIKNDLLENLDKIRKIKSINRSLINAFISEIEQENISEIYNLLLELNDKNNLLEEKVEEDNKNFQERFKELDIRIKDVIERKDKESEVNEKNKIEINKIQFDLKNIEELYSSFKKSISFLEEQNIQYEELNEIIDKKQKLKKELEENKNIETSIQKKELDIKSEKQNKINLEETKERIKSEGIKLKKRQESIKQKLKVVFFDDNIPIELKQYLFLFRNEEISCPEDISENELKVAIEIVEYLKSKNNRIFQINEEIKSEVNLAISKGEQEYDLIEKQKEELRLNYKNTEFQIKKSEENILKIISEKEELEKKRKSDYKILLIELTNEISLFKENKDILDFAMNDNILRNYKEIIEKLNLLYEKDDRNIVNRALIIEKIKDFLKNDFIEKDEMKKEISNKIKQIDIELELLEKEKKKLENLKSTDYSIIDEIKYFIENSFNSELEISDNFSNFEIEIEENFDLFLNKLKEDFKFLQNKEKIIERLVSKIINSELEKNVQVQRYWKERKYDHFIEKSKSLLDFVSLLDNLLKEFDNEIRNNSSLENNINNLYKIIQNIQKDISTKIKKSTSFLKNIKSKSGHYYYIKDEKYMINTEEEKNFITNIKKIFNYDIEKDADFNIEENAESVNILVEKTDIEMINQFYDSTNNLLKKDGDIFYSFKQLFEEKTKDFQLVVFNSKQEISHPSSGNAFLLNASLKDKILSENKHYKGIFFGDEIASVDLDNNSIIKTQSYQNKIVLLGNQGFEGLRNGFIEIMNQSLEKTTDDYKEVSNHIMWMDKNE